MNVTLSTSKKARYAEVNLAERIGGYDSYSYKIPRSMENEVRNGRCVIVAFRGRYLVGIVHQISDRPVFRGRLLPLLTILLETTFFPEGMSNLLQGVREYYCLNHRELFNLFYPETRRDFKVQFRVKGTNFPRKVRCLLNPTTIELLSKPPLNKWRPAGILTRGQASIEESWVISDLVQKELVEFRVGWRAVHHQRDLLARDLFRLAVPDSWDSVCPAMGKLLAASKAKGLPAVGEPFLRTYLNLRREQVTDLAKQLSTELEEMPPGEANGSEVSISSHYEERNYYENYDQLAESEGQFLEALGDSLNRGEKVLLLLPEYWFIDLLLPFLLKHSERTVILRPELCRENRDLTEQLLQDERGLLVVGARSIVFHKLVKYHSVFVLDELNERYIPEEFPRIPAPTLAKALARFWNVPIHLHSFEQRLSNYAICPEEGRGKPIITVISPQLAGAEVFTEEEIARLKGSTEASQRVIIFLNALHYTSLFYCLECFSPIVCPDCLGNLEYIKERRLYRCAQCQSYEVISILCPKCGSSEIATAHGGVFKGYEELQVEFPFVNSVVLHAHSTLPPEEFRKAQVVIATSKIFSMERPGRFDLLLLKDLDRILLSPAFDSYEYATGLLTRLLSFLGKDLKDILISTRIPRHPFFRYLDGLGLKNFFQKELSSREELGLPPFSRLLRYRIRAEKKRDVTIFRNRVRQIVYEEIPAALLTDRNVLKRPASCLFHTSGEIFLPLGIKADFLYGLRSDAARKGVIFVYDLS